MKAFTYMLLFLLIAIIASFVAQIVAIRDKTEAGNHVATVPWLRIIKDALMGVYAKLATKGHKMSKDHKITEYVVSMPSGTPGSRRWTERWYVEIKDEKSRSPSASMNRV